MVHYSSVKFNVISFTLKLQKFPFLPFIDAFSVGLDLGIGLMLQFKPMLQIYIFRQQQQ